LIAVSGDPLWAMRCIHSQSAIENFDLTGEFDLGDPLSRCEILTHPLAL